ncbi:chitin deacetylase [Mortierella sp. GBA43]|nr:chitin deacetylase [Mortierella sp. GBA43]
MALAIFLTTAAAQAQFNAAAFPPANEVPPVTSPEVKEWLKGLNFDDVPKFPIHTGNPPACPALAQIPADQCWWTCQSCPGTDIETCPNPGDWGLTFDDGPTPNTTPLLQILKEHNAKATFFVMGSNVVRNADILKQEVADGHHIASHTWSHHPLTTLTNEQIVAEVKWNEKAVEDITGLKMKYIRPPYGDIDARVRAVLKKLGYTVVDWTSDAYDSKDFSLNATPNDVAKLTAAVTTLANTLTTYGANPGAKGVITLQHDLYPVTIDYARRLFPAIAQAKLKPMTVAQCLGDATPYQNGAGPSAPNTPNPSAPGGGAGSSNGTAGKSTGNNSPTGGQSGASGLSVSSSAMLGALALLGAVFATL